MNILFFCVFTPYRTPLMETTDTDPASFFVLSIPVFYNRKFIINQPAIIAGYIHYPVRITTRWGHISLYDPPRAQLIYIPIFIFFRDFF